MSPPDLEANGENATLGESNCCDPGRHGLADDQLVADVETMAAMGNETRYEALRHIAAADGAVCVCEIEPALGVSQGAVSQALSRLYTAGLVSRRKEGRWRYYETTDRADSLLRTLDRTRGGDDV